MNTTSVETLIRLYFDGKTSLEQERQLKAYFSQEKLPDEHKPLRPLFIVSHSKTDALDDSFDEKVLTRIESSSKSKNIYNHFLFWPIAAASLALLILISGLFRLNTSSRFEETYNDPAQAYAQAVSALQFVGIKLSDAIQPMQKAGEELEKGVDQVNKLQMLNISIEETQKLGLIDQALKFMPIQ